MFGSSNPFGQASGSSPFGTQTQSVFGQGNNTSNNNPFAQKPFGTSTPFGAQTGSSMFGGTSTGVFGAPQTSSPFGASSQAFGTTTPAFGASSTPAFGNSTSTFGGSSTFGQKSFGSSMPQSSPFGSTTQQSQPAFGNNTFGSSTPFGASNTSAFGASSTPAFGATNTPAFGATGTPAFGAATSTPGFGATSIPGFGATSTPGFGASSTSAFGSTNTSAFGASSTPSFSASSSPAFGVSPTPAFGSSGTAFGNNAFGSGGAFGASRTSAFGASSTPAFGASSSPSFNFGSTPAFGQSTSAVGSTSFGAQGSNSMFGGQQGGSRVMPYAPTTEADSAGVHPTPKLQSISAMPVYKEKCQEELRWEDYQRGDKGGQPPAGQSPGGAGFGVPNSQPSVFSVSPTNQANPFGQTPTNSSNPFGQTPTNSSNPFGQTPTNSSNPFGQTPTNSSNPFGQTPTNAQPSVFSVSPTNQANPFGQTPTNPSNPFGQTSTTPSIFGSTSSNNTSVFGSSLGFATVTPQPFGSASAQGQGSTPPFSIGGNFNNSLSAPLFNSNTTLGPTGSTFGQNTNPGFAQINTFSTPSTGFANTFSTSSSLTTNITPFGQTTPTGLTSYQSVKPAQPLGAFSFNNNGQTQIANNTTGCSLGLGAVNQGGNYGQVSAPPSSIVMPIPVTNPFGTLPALPQISIAQGGNSPSIQYGISSMPVVDKPAPVRVSPFLTCRHLSQRRVSLPTRKYRPGDDSPKVPFYEEENSNTPKADAFFIPRENPRALFIRPIERAKSAHPKDCPSPLQENGKSSSGVTNGAKHENKNNSETREAPPVKAAEASPVKANQKQNGTHENHGGEDKKSSYSSPSGADVKSLMPKLNHSEYFTEPRIQELAAKETVDPGYCKRVKGFVVGRHGYGSIKFLGETDVCRLDLEMLVQFQNREVNVYMDESKKPPVGQGLNKPAVVTLLNIKCMDKKSGKQVTEGVRLDKYKEMLKRKAKEQGAEFVSYDPVNGEWMFKVEHF